VERGGRPHLPEIEAVLLDIDGVLRIGDDAVPGAVEAVKQLRSADLALRFVTNTTSQPSRRITEELERLGFEPGPEAVVTPAGLAIKRCRELGHGRVMLLMNEAVKEDFGELQETEDEADAVIVGDLGEEFSYEILNRAFRAVIDGAALIALQKNRYWLKPNGLSLDVGPFVAALEYATEKEADVVGKPAPSFFELALDGLDVEPGQAAMVGDDIESDVGGALEAGIPGILVRTGKYREDAAEASSVEPTATVDSIADVPALLRSEPRSSSG
jgi:HAD superfamily hydrolase (TIGR01458 family)